MKPQSIEKLAAILQAGSGLAIGPDKTYLLESRLTPLLAPHGLASLDALAERISLQPATIASNALRQEVIEAMTTNESFFFRDEKPFAHFRNHALPYLIANRPATATLRIWSAAASTGQEAYSLAMILADCQAQIGGRNFEIIGTDLSREAIARAQSGLYSQFEVQRGLPIQNLVKYFRKEGAQWRITDQLRKAVQFRCFNLLGDLRSLGLFDVVFCRNVLIYFDQPTKARVLDAIAGQMAADGVLYLGGAETVLGITTAFVAQSGERCAYERSQGAAATNARQAVTAR